MKDYAFPQLVSAPAPARPTMSARLLGDLAQLFRVESARAKAPDEAARLWRVSQKIEARYRQARNGS